VVGKNPDNPRREGDLCIESDSWRVGVRPTVGAALTFGQIRHGDSWVDLLTPATFLGRTAASFPLIPWSNRIAGGRVVCGDRDYQLACDDEPGLNAIHGVVRNFPWSITAAGPSQCRLAFDSRGMTGVNWPWDFSAQITYAARGPELLVRTTLRNRDRQAFPAGIGHHPYFRRSLTGPSDQVQLTLPANQAFDLVNYLAVAPPEPVPAHLDFRVPRGFGTDLVIDDCLTGRTPGEPARLEYPESGRVIELKADPVFQCYVLYVPQGGQDIFALEPVTNANNGLVLDQQGLPGSGVVSLGPGATLSGSFTLRVVT
jgi:aldose 1-epimerase